VPFGTASSHDAFGVRRLLQVGQRVVALVGRVRRVAVAGLRAVVGVPAVRQAGRPLEHRTGVGEVAGGTGGPDGWKFTAYAG
jgi:hypothetical protein